MQRQSLRRHKRREGAAQQPLGRMSCNTPSPTARAASGLGPPTPTLSPCPTPSTRTSAEKMAFMTAMYCDVASGQPTSTSTRGLGAWRSAAAPAPAAAPGGGRCTLWMKHSARDSAPASAPGPRSAPPPALARRVCAAAWLAGGGGRRPRPLRRSTRRRPLHHRVSHASRQQSRHHALGLFNADARHTSSATCTQPKLCLHESARFGVVRQPNNLPQTGTLKPSQGRPAARPGARRRAARRRPRAGAGAAARSARASCSRRAPGAAAPRPAATATGTAGGCGACSAVCKLPAQPGWRRVCVVEGARRAPVAAVHREHGQPVAIVKQQERVQEHEHLLPRGTESLMVLCTSRMRAQPTEPLRVACNLYGASACCTKSSGASAVKSAALAPSLAARSLSQNSPRVSSSTTSRLLSPARRFFCHQRLSGAPTPRFVWAASSCERKVKCRNAQAGALAASNSGAGDCARFTVFHGA